MLYLSIAATYLLATPMLEKPDEQGHYGYILYLKTYRKLPPLKIEDQISIEFKQPPLYYATVWAVTTFLPPEPMELPETNPYLDLAAPGYRNDNRAVYLHPPTHTPVEISGRIVSLTFGLGTMVVAYHLARRFFPTHPDAARAVAILVGFQPRFLYMATALNNDAPAAFFGALTSLLLLKRLQGAARPTLAPLTGFVIGLALLNKASALIFIPLVGIVLVACRSGTLKERLREGAVILGIAMLISGWWYARNALHHGDPLALTMHTAQATARSLMARLRELPGVEYTFWGNLARPYLSPHLLDKVLIWWGRISTLLVLLGIIRSQDVTPQQYRITLVLITFPLAFLGALVVIWNARASYPLGRLLLPTVSIIMVLWTWGWERLLVKPWRRVALNLSGGLMLCVGLVTPWVLIFPLYHPYYAPQPGQGITTSYTFLSESDQPIAELIAYHIPDPYAKPGDYVSLELCWRTLKRTTEPYAIFVQLLDMSQIDSTTGPPILGGRRTYPGLGNLPTDRWPVRFTFCDMIGIPIHEDVATPVRATIEVGLIHPETSQRLSARTSEGNRAFVTLPGPAIMIPPANQAIQASPAYLLDQAIAIQSLAVQQTTKADTPQGNDQLTVQITWQANNPVTYNAVVFAHLYNANGKLISQLDVEPLQGRFPTSVWVPGQVLTDTLQLPLPNSEEVPVRLDIGMYRRESMERLPITDQAGSTMQDRLISIPIPGAD